MNAGVPPFSNPTAKKGRHMAFSMCLSFLLLHSQKCGQKYRFSPSCLDLLLDGSQQQSGFQRLRNMFVHSGLLRFLAVVGKGVGRHGNNGHRCRIRPIHAADTVNRRADIMAHALQNFVLATLALSALRAASISSATNSAAAIYLRHLFISGTSFIGIVDTAFRKTLFFHR